MYGTDVPSPSDFDQEPDEFRAALDEFRAALERNALARWWRDRAGATGETGARLIARDVPYTQSDESDPAGIDV
jgi:hypothetical protein